MDVLAATAREATGLRSMLRINGRNLRDEAQFGNSAAAGVLLGPFNQRIRDVQVGPDGNLYVATEGQTGGNATDGMILKIEPVN